MKKIKNLDDLFVKCMDAFQEQVAELPPLPPNQYYAPDYGFKYNNGEWIVTTKIVTRDYEITPRVYGPDCGTTCGDNRFEVIAKAKKDLLEKTNIESAPDEMAVLDSILFRAWQMGWLKKYEED